MAAVAATALLVSLSASGAARAAGGDSTQSGQNGRHSTDYVTRSGSELTLDGRPFRFAGTNNYYLMYSSQTMVDDVLARAAAARFTVLRTWGWLDIGNADGSNSVSGKKNGVYFQYWDGQAPAYNDGADGLAKLDYVVWKAGQSGIRLVIPFTNNWSDFGGIDQYVRWAGKQHHDDFYTDPTIRRWYQSWISHLLNHVNPRTGLAYKDDPTIMTWELANEPRCKGSGLYPQSTSCTTGTLTEWADTMTGYIKSIDRHHLASVGDEGFYCTDPGGTDWTTNCGEGVDVLALTKLPAVDVMSYHLYPDSWGKDPGWGTGWVTRHVGDAKRQHKAVMLGEFGYRDKSTRNRVYQTWTDAFVQAGGDGALYWILSGLQDDGTFYPDYDGFTVYCPSPVCQTLTNTSVRIGTGRRVFPPVADHDATTTRFGTPVTVTPTANDIAYRTTVRPATIDLDPATPGRQATLAGAGGQFAANGEGAVTFTPAAGFAGKATAHYQVRDGFGQPSNVADIVVTVKPDPGAPIRLASFEDGTQGWAPGNWQTDAGSGTSTSMALQVGGQATRGLRLPN
jgi:mannan endo-1,4-beta-mannosidase